MKPPRRAASRRGGAEWRPIMVRLERLNVEAEELLRERERIGEALDGLLAFLRQPGPLPRNATPVAEPPAPR